MAKPQNGKWVGVVTLQSGGGAVRIDLHLKFGDDGSVTGSFEVHASPSTGWNGPERGELRNGRYSEEGSRVHLEYESSRNERAVFEGQYQAAAGRPGAILGAVEVLQGEKKDSGTLAAVHSTVEKDIAMRVW